MAADANAALPRLEPGAIWAGKYRIERAIGSGGMGHVFAATHVLLGTDVALKFMRQPSPKRKHRLLQEARAVLALDCEQVVRVFDADVADGVPYLVMELLEGADLGAWLRERGPLPVEEAVDYVIQAAAGVASAHRHGIVHRDLKPSNLFRVSASPWPLIKVLDFGISKLLWPTEVEITATSSLLGSPHYMSPEQLRNPRLVDPRSDVWALGATLFALLCGRPPFVAESLTAVTIAIATEPIPRLADFRIDAPPGLDLALAGALDKRPERRLRSAAAFAERLAPFASAPGKRLAEQMVAQEHQVGAAASATAAALASAGSHDVPTATDDLRRRTDDLRPRGDAASAPPVEVRRHTRPWGLAGRGAAFLAALGFVALSLLRRGGPGGVPAPVPAKPAVPAPVSSSASVAPVSSLAPVVAASSSAPAPALPSPTPRSRHPLPSARTKSPDAVAPSPPAGRDAGGPGPTAAHRTDVDGFEIVE